MLYDLPFLLHAEVQVSAAWSVEEDSVQVNLYACPLSGGVSFFQRCR
jgi:hypothetical protein